MKIVITNGVHEADYIISMFNSRKNDLVVINDDEEACSYLSANNGIPVMFGRSTRERDLREAGAEDADLFIALSKNDMDNYVACQTAKKLLNARKCIATVLNPKNVEVFKKLGIDAVVSSSYLLGEQIKNTISLETLIDTLTLENEKILIMEIMVTPDNPIYGHTLKDVNISDKGSVSAVIRNDKVIIPNGNTEFMDNDKVLIVTTVENHEYIRKAMLRNR